VLVAGNHEQQAAAGAERCGCGYGDPEDERLGCLAHVYALNSLSDDRRAWLGTWPDRLVLDTRAGRVLLCHGSQDRTNEFLYESELDDDRLVGWLHGAGAVAMACTHTGLPWVRPLGGGRLAINCGVVGKPDHDGDPAVHYALLHLDGAAIRAEIRRVAYDHQAWADQLASEGVEPIFTEPLRDGWWTVGRNSLPQWERDERPRQGAA